MRAEDVECACSTGVASLLTGRSRRSTFTRVVAVTTKGRVERDRLPGVLLAATVLVVQVVWGAALFYLGFHFL
jgi:hypothetical protein